MAVLPPCVPASTQTNRFIDFQASTWPRWTDLTIRPDFEEVLNR
jgi:hypothetical protein